MDGKITIGTELDTKSFDAQIQVLETKANELEKMIEDPKSFGLSDREVADVNAELEKTKNRLIDLNKQKEKLGQTQGPDMLGKSFQKAIGQAGKLTLAIFGIRSAYLAVRQASSSLASYDKQYAANLEYIRYVLTQAIAPILRYVVSLAGTLLSYIYYILNAWFGIGRFINAGAKGFAKMKAGAGGTAKAVKEIKKQLAGFDEINILQENADQDSVGGGGGGISMPNFDATKLQGPVPKWLEFIAKNKKAILAVLGFLAGAALLGKIVTFIAKIKALAGGATAIVTAIKGFIAGMTLIKGLGLVALIAGVVSLIRNLILLIKDPSWANFGKTLTSIGLILAGIGAMTGNLPLLIGGLITTVVGAATAFLTEEKSIKSVTDAKKELEEATKGVISAEQAYVNAVDRVEQATENLRLLEQKSKESGEELYKSVENGTLTYTNMTSAQREVYKAYLETQAAQENLTTATDEMTAAKDRESEASLQLRLSTLKEQGQMEEYRDVVVKAYEDGEISADEARKAIELAMKDMSKSSRQTFTKDLPSDLKEGLDPDKYRSKADRLADFFNDLGRRIREALSFNVHANFSVDGGTGAGGGSYGGRAKGGVFYPSLLPKLASGGIISMPGRGMPYNGAIIGERGAEAVVPLTDSQQMELLGATIGKYITINANITNSMNGKVLSRELKRITNEQDFAYNT